MSITKIYTVQAPIVEILRKPPLLETIVSVIIAKKFSILSIKSLFEKRQDTVPMQMRQGILSAVSHSHILCCPRLKVRLNNYNNLGKLLT